MATSTLVATPGASNANVYLTLVEAEQFHVDRPAAGTTWADASDATKNKALLWATKLMDAMWEWTGFVVTETQALLWPRSGMSYRSGYFVESTVIPDELKDATAEFARQLIAADRAADSDIETQGITSLRVGSIGLEFKDSVWPKVVPDAVVNLIPEGWGSPSGRLKGFRAIKRW